MNSRDARAPGSVVPVTTGSIATELNSVALTAVTPPPEPSASSAGCGPVERCVRMPYACLAVALIKVLQGLGDLDFGGDDDGKVEGTSGDLGAVRAWIPMPASCRSLMSSQSSGALGLPAVRCRIRLPLFVDRAEGGGWSMGTAPRAEGVGVAEYLIFPNDEWVTAVSDEGEKN
jgi:hypothetical protein